MMLIISHKTLYCPPKVRLFRGGRASITVCVVVRTTHAHCPTLHPRHPDVGPLFEPPLHESSTVMARLDHRITTNWLRKPSDSTSHRKPRQFKCFTSLYPSKLLLELANLTKKWGYCVISAMAGKGIEQ